MLIQVWKPYDAAYARTLAPFHSRNQNGDEFISIPEPTFIAKRNLGCKACGCPLELGTKAIRLKRFSGFEKRQEPDSYSYLHAEDCWQDGFIQTMHLNKVNIMRVRQGCKTFDVFYEVEPKIQIVLGSIPPNPWDTKIVSNYDVNAVRDAEIADHRALFDMQTKARSDNRKKNKAEEGTKRYNAAMKDLDRYQATPSRVKSYDVSPTED